MKLLPTIVTVSSIACGLTQALSLAPSITPSSDPVCPPKCGDLAVRELLKLVKEGYPNILNELDEKYTLLPSGIPIGDILSTISDHPSSDGNSPNEDKPEDGNSPKEDKPEGIKVPFVQVGDPTEFANEIEKLPEKIPTTTIDKLIAKKPKTLTSAFKIVCKNLGRAFEAIDFVDIPLDTEKLVKDLKNLKDVDRLDLISIFLHNVMPLQSDGNRVFRSFKFMRNMAKKKPEMRNIFKGLVSIEVLPDVASMPFQKLMTEIANNNPNTELHKAVGSGDCGCFDFSDSTVLISKVDIPDHTAVSDALDLVPENIPSKTISKFASKKPRTFGNGLRLISPHLANAFKDTGLDVPLDISRFNADVQSAARQNGGKLNRNILIAHLFKNIEPSNPIETYRIIIFFRNIVRYNPDSADIISRVIPSKKTRRAAAWPEKDFVKEIVKYNPNSHIVKSLTGRSTLSVTGHPSKYHYRHGHGGPFGLGAIAINPENHKKIQEIVAKSRLAVDPITSNSIIKGAPKIGIPKIEHPLHPRIGTTLIDPKKAHSTGKPGATNTGAKLVTPKSTLSIPSKSATKGTPKIGIPKIGHPIHPRIGTTVIDPKKGHSTGKPGATKIAPKPIGKIGTTKVAPKPETETVKKVDSAGAKPTTVSNGATTAASAQKAAGTATTAASSSDNAVANGATGAKSSVAKSDGFKTGGIKPAREQSGGAQSNGAQSGDAQSGGAQSSGSQSSGSQSGDSASESYETWTEVITRFWTEQFIEIVTEVYTEIVDVEVDTEIVQQ